VLAALAADAARSQVDRIAGNLAFVISGRDSHHAGCMNCAPAAIKHCRHWQGVM
jgi:hypothetical protein